MPRPHARASGATRFRRVLAACAALLGAGSGAIEAIASQDTDLAAKPLVVPAWRQADKVAVLTLEGAIDAITAMSIRRRIDIAEKGGADALVIDINSPGGEVGAVLEITNAIKGSAISNTVAWVNPDAYSGGAIVALACREIIVNSPASMGDAFPVTMTSVPGQSRMGLRGLTPDERTKILPVLLADVTDSARRAGWDEYMVQAIIIDGIELWWVQDTRTGRRMAINENEYRMLFGREPVRGKPAIAGVTGGVRTGPDPIALTEDDPEQATTPETPESGAATPSDATGQTDAAGQADEPAPDPSSPPPTPGPEGGADAPQPEGRRFLPASDSLRDIAREFDSPERTDLRIEPSSQRPVLTPADAGHFRDLGYLTDGTAPIVMREDQMKEYGFADAVVRNDEELRAYFGAVELVRLDESWSEKFVRVMTGGLVRGVLIAVMLIALFIEMMSPGLTVPGAIAATCLVLLLAPPALIGMAGWWELLAIGLGVVLLGLEVFVVPGFGVFGVLGVVALFGGLLGTFVPSGGSLGNPAIQESLMRGAVTILLAGATAGIGIYLIARNFDRVPLLDRLVLGAGSPDEDEEGVRTDTELLRAASRDPAPGTRVGMTGVAVTPLRPSGQADIEGRLVDVVADLGILDPGTPVRVVAVEGLRIVVADATEGRA